MIIQTLLYCCARFLLLRRTRVGVRVELVRICRGGVKSKMMFGWGGMYVAFFFFFDRFFFGSCFFRRERRARTDDDDDDTTPSRGGHICFSHPVLVTAPKKLVYRLQQPRAQSLASIAGLGNQDLGRSAHWFGRGAARAQSIISEVGGFVLPFGARDCTSVGSGGLSVL